MAGMPRYARADAFLSREEHLEFRGITTLLELLDSAEPLDRDLIIMEDNPKDASDLHTKCLSRLFVRGDESVVVGRTEGHGAVAVGMNVGFGYRAMANNVPQDPDARPSDPTFEPIPSTSEGQSVSIPLLSMSLPYFVEALRKHEWQPIEGGHLPFPFPFELHCKNIVTMLQLVYSHHNEDDERRRWYDKRALRDYVVLSSCSKIKRTFDEGFSQYGLWMGQCIEMDGTTQFSGEEHHTFTKGFNNKPASTVERSVLSAILNRLLESGVLTEAKAFELGWISSENAFSCCKPIYDGVGRAHFQTIMSMTFRHAKTCVEQLAVELAKNVPQLGRHYDIPDVPLIEAIKTIKQATKAAWSSLLLWHCFLEIFDSIIDLHIGWLEQIIQPDHTNTPFLPEPFVQQSFMHGIQTNRSNSSNRAYFGPPKVTDYTNNSPQAILANKIESTSLYKQNSWGAALKHYLRRTDEYVTALLALEPSPHREEKDNLHHFVSRMDFRAFEFCNDPGSRDAEMSSVCSIISRLAESNPDTFTSRHIQLIKKWLYDTLKTRQAGILTQKQFDELLVSTDFAGTCHVEAIPMALSMLSTSKLLEFCVDVRTLGLQLETDESQSLRIPERRVIDAFQGLREPLTVSTPCCPACGIFSQGLREHQGGSGVLAHHRIWSAVALPPWTLKEKGRLVIDEAKRVLAKRLERVSTLPRKIRAEKLDEIKKMPVAAMSTRGKVTEEYEDVIKCQGLWESENMTEAKEGMRGVPETKRLEAEVGELQSPSSETMGSKRKGYADEGEEAHVGAREIQKPPPEPKRNKRQRRAAVEEEANVEEGNMRKPAPEPKVSEGKRELAEEGEAKVGEGTIKVKNENQRVVTRSQRKKTGEKLYGEKRAPNGDFLLCG